MRFGSARIWFPEGGDDQRRTTNKLHVEINAHCVMIGGMARFTDEADATF
jgi:hypothetical protein